MDKLNMLAELLYAEACFKANPLRQMLLEKAYSLFDYVEENGSTFSINRRQRMEKIRQELIKRPKTINMLKLILENRLSN